jgi:hypothetical protein
VSWAKSHASLPQAVPAADGRVRIYLSARDEDGRSNIGFAELDPSAERPKFSFGGAPVLAPGKRGAFDDSGVTMSCLVRHDSTSFLYYTGWSLGRTVPIYLFAGLAVSEGGDRFERVSAAPILERNAADPLLTASPWVLRDEGRWRMWYVSATEWELADGEPRHRYHVRYGESHDGISWRRDGIVCIDFKDADEYAISRPCVVRDGDLYRMWFAARGASYRIGYAESSDGVEWDRFDERAGIRSTGDWDAEMQAYPSVFDHDGRRYLLYNGNGYGRTGVGWAVATASA